MNVTICVFFTAKRMLNGDILMDYGLIYSDEGVCILSLKVLQEHPISRRPLGWTKKLLKRLWSCWRQDFIV